MRGETCLATDQRGALECVLGLGSVPWLRAFEEGLSDHPSRENLARSQPRAHSLTLTDSLNLIHSVTD